MNYHIDVQEVQRCLRLIVEPGQVTELRALEAIVGTERRPGTFSGYFDDPAKLLDAVKRIKSAKGVYVIPNPVRPELLARSMNKARIVGKEPLTGDDGILRRRWLLIDCDPRRAAGIASSDGEHDAARQRVNEIDAYLSERGCRR